LLREKSTKPVVVLNSYTSQITIELNTSRSFCQRVKSTRKALNHPQHAPAESADAAPGLTEREHALQYSGLRKTLLFRMRFEFHE
jgi:hypothetical protein